MARVAAIRSCGGVGGSDGGRMAAFASASRSSGTGRRPTTSRSLAASNSSLVSAHDGTPPSSWGMANRFSNPYSTIQRRNPMGDSATISTSSLPRMSMWYSILAANECAPMRSPRRRAMVCSDMPNCGVTCRPFTTAASSPWIWATSTYSFCTRWRA